MTAVDTAPVRGFGFSKTGEWVPPQLLGGFTGYTDLTLDKPTPEGRTQFRLTAGLIDGDAESFFGRGFCHWLAGAIHCLTGWELITYDRQQPDGSWFPVHTAVVTPTGTVLDIFGEHPPQAVIQRYEQGGQYVVRTRNVRNEDMPSKVLVGIRDLQGDRFWWTRTTFGTPELTAMVVHFARTLVRHHGYGHLLRHTPPQQQTRIDARPAERRPQAPRTPTTTTTTASGGSAMGIDDIRQAMAISSEKAHFIQGAMAQSEMWLDEILAQLHNAGAQESGQQGVTEAFAAFTQAKTDLEQFKGQISNAAALIEQYATQL